MDKNGFSVRRAHAEPHPIATGKGVSCLVSREHLNIGRLFARHATRDHTSKMRYDNIRPFRARTIAVPERHLTKLEVIDYVPHRFARERPVRAWRNWQTRQLEGLVPARACWFDPSRAHHIDASRFNTYHFRLLRLQHRCNSQGNPRHSAINPPTLHCRRYHPPY